MDETQRRDGNGPSEASCVVTFHLGKENELTLLSVEPLPDKLDENTLSIPPHERKKQSPAVYDREAKDESSEKVVDLASSSLSSVIDVVNGLSSSVVLAQRNAHGWNESVEEKTPWYILVFRKFWGPVPCMIEAALIICFVLGENENGGIITLLLVVNALIALREERKANLAVEQLKETLQIIARCKREGQWKEIPSRELVPGDLLRIRHGDLTPADLVVIDGHLEADQSALTGESELKYLQKGRLCYAGSVIKKGEASGIVWAVGEKTFFGNTAKLVQNSKPSDHVQAIMSMFVKYFMSIVIALIIITIIVLAVRHDDVEAAIPLLLAVLITALPVALPVIFTVSMAVGAQALVRDSVLVTRLNVLQDASQMRILFSDKTGTLTMNKLSVQGVWVAPSLSEERKSVTTENDVLFASLLCSRHENNDPIDLAIFKRWDERKNESEAKIDENVPVSSADCFQVFDANVYKPVRFLPFDAETRRTDATVVRSIPEGVEAIRALKGAVATLCELSGIHRDSDAWCQIHDHVKEQSAKGFRTIAVCSARITLEKMNVDQFPPESTESSGAGGNGAGLSSLFTSFTFMGILSFYDPPRADTLETLQSLSSMGIQTKMLTGDNHLVACQIARQLHFPGEIINLEDEKKKIRVAAEDPSAVSEEEVMKSVFTKFDPLSDHISGFAQIFPSDKHAIVQFAQSKGILCGMTGDGVNDAPALKAAEVGAAMSNATDIAKMAASACLLAEGLSGILSLVRVGRVVHRRASVWLIYKVAKSLVHSIFILIFYLAIGYFPINTLQVILLLLLMDFALISIATDRQSGAPQPTSWPLFQYFRIGLFLGILGAGQLMAIILYSDYVMDLDEDQLNTLSFCLMFFFGFFAMLSCREKLFFWKSIPSNLINSIFVVESIGIILFCVFGVPGFAGLGAAWIFVSVGVTTGLFIWNDFLKGMYSITFEKDYVTAG